jgi:tetratricopeptide (TPR) repeat protein
MLYELKDYRASGLVYAKMEKLYPEDPNVMSGLGWCLVYQGKKSRALPIFARLVVIAPDYAYAQRGYQLCGGKK